MRKKNQRFSRVRRPQRDHRINEDITEPSVRLITGDGATCLPSRQNDARQNLALILLKLQDKVTCRSLRSSTTEKSK